MRRRSAGVLTLAQAVAILVLPPCSNADRVGYYVGGDVGGGKADIDSGEFHAASQIESGNVGADSAFRQTSADNDDLTYGAIVGYAFSPYLAVEAQYLWLGEYALAAAATGADGEDAAEAAGSWESEGPAVSVLGSWPLSSRWDVYGRVGAFWAEIDATLQLEDLSSATRTKIRETTTELIWGIGAAYHATPQWTVRLEYEQLPDVGDGDRSGELDVERYTLGWVYSY